jgi:CheY-like chemotaxis protein
MIKKKLRILLAEGDHAETTAGLRELYPESQDSLELTVVSTIPTLIATLEIVNPEVIFVDLSLAHPDPLGAVRRVHRSAPDVPLIVLADSSDKNCAALAVDAAEPSAPVLCQRMEKRIAVLNRDRGPRDPLELRISARFWSSKEIITFSEFLDSVEAGLRLPAIPFAQETASRGKIEAAEKR